MQDTKQVDLLVIGGGAGGMTAALTAKLAGLDVLLCEKEPYVGGITATSGGTTWVPGTHLSEEAGVPDTVEAAREFLSHVCAGKSGGALREAFLRAGPAMIRELAERTEVKFAAALAHPDYIGPLPGEAYGGRALAPLPFDGKLLGADFDRVRPPRREFMGLGGMMVNRNELPALLNPLQSAQHFKTAFHVVWPYLKDRLAYRRGTRLVMGNALVARLLYSLNKAGAEIWYEAALDGLIREGGAVSGALIRQGGRTVRVSAAKGVVLATGGVGWNASLRQRFFPAGTPDSFAPAANSGDGISAGEAAGAALANTDAPALWFSTSYTQKRDGYLAMWPHIILDRAKPGLLAVDGEGRRFANESASYHDFSSAQLRHHRHTPSLPAHLIVDEAFIRRYGLGFIMPGGRKLAHYVERNYVVRADTLAGLARRIGVPEDNLAATVQRYNELAVRGEDSDFGRGSSAMSRFNGDAAVSPNPCLRPLSPHGPYFALAVRPADLAGSLGLDCDENGRVLDTQGAPIEGLFACGNDAASIFRGTYPGPGTTIGPAMVFGWRIGKFAAGRPAD